MCKDVHGKEDYTLRYMATQQIDEGKAGNNGAVGAASDRAGGKK